MSSAIICQTSQKDVLVFLDTDIQEVFERMSHFQNLIQLLTIFGFNAGKSAESCFTQIGACKWDNHLVHTKQHLGTLVSQVSVNFFLKM